MDKQIIKSYYDVVIIGAGIAGLECAKNLGGSDLNILLIERNKDISKKVCANGITLKDMEYIPRNILNFSFQKILIHYKNKTVVFPRDGTIISTVDKKRLLRHQLRCLKKFNNIEILTAVSVLGITSNNSLKLNSGKEIRFRFLMGADGSNSIVRKYLKLSVKKLEIAFQYIIPKNFKNFEIYLDDKLFGTGFLWIFPHKNYTSIGCGSDIRFTNSKKQKNNLDLWLKRNGIDISSARFEMALINYDYKGYKFGNIFLAGDAAGLTSGITGKGIYSAFLSGKQIAKDILQKDNSCNFIVDWTKKKNLQEKFMFFLKNSFLRNIFFSIVIKFIAYRRIQDKLYNL